MSDQPTRADLRLRTTRAEEHSKTLQRLILQCGETLDRAIEAHGIVWVEPKVELAEDELTKRCHHAEAEINFLLTYATLFRKAVLMPDANPRVAA